MSLLTACGSDAPAGPQPSLGPAAFDPTRTAASQSPQPRIKAAVRKAAQEEFATYANGDYGAAWDLWTAEAQRTIPRSTYKQLNKLCRPPTAGTPFKITKIRLAAESATVRVTRAKTVFTVQFVYQQGQWRFVPSQSMLRDHQQIRLHGLRKFVAAQKQKGRCTSTAPTSPAPTSP